MRVLAIACVWLVVACSGRSGSAKQGPRLQIVYSIDLDRAVDDRAADLRKDLEVALADEKIVATVHVPVAPLGALTVTPSDAERRPAIEQLVRSSYGTIVESMECAASAGPLSICFKIGAAYADTLKKSALASAVGTIRARLVELEVASPTVVEKAGQIVVEFPSDDRRGHDIRDRIARTGKLEMKVVDHGSEYMRRVFAHVGSEGDPGQPTEPGAREAEIRADIDQWRLDEGGPASIDYYLVASDRSEALTVEEAKQRGCFARPAVDGKVPCTVTGRDVIERYLARLAAADPSFRVPDDRQLAYELVYPGPGGTDKRPYWRSYLLERAVRLTGSAIAKAESSFDPIGKRPIVLLDFNRHGTQLFAELTAEIVGKKLATIVDGRIKSAPIINGPIPHGRASITMGGGELRDQERERDELVTALKTGALPAPLREESLIEIEPR